MKAKREFDINERGQSFEYVSVEEAKKLEAKIEYLEYNLLSLLAVIHRDGGHHTAEVSPRQSAIDAQRTWIARQTEIERLRDSDKVNEKQLVDIAAFLGGDARNVKGNEKSIVGLVKQKIKQLKANLALEQKLGLEVIADYQNELAFARKDRRDTYGFYATLFKELSEAAEKNFNQEKRECTLDPESRKESETE